MRMLLPLPVSNVNPQRTIKRKKDARRSKRIALRCKGFIYDVQIVFFKCFFTDVYIIDVLNFIFVFVQNFIVFVLKTKLIYL